MIAIVDLGKYAVTVLSAWGATAVLLGALVVVSLWQGRRVRRALSEAEARVRGGHGT